MRGSNTSARRIGRVLLTVVLSDLAYRLFMREPLRRSLGIEVQHA
jgi:hypothetical protein